MLEIQQYHHRMEVDGSTIETGLNLGEYRRELFESELRLTNHVFKIPLTAASQSPPK